MTIYCEARMAPISHSVAMITTCCSGALAMTSCSEAPKLTFVTGRMGVVTWPVLPVRCPPTFLRCLTVTHPSYRGMPKSREFHDLNRFNCRSGAWTLACAVVTDGI